MMKLSIPRHQSAKVVLGEEPVTIQLGPDHQLVCDEYTALQLRQALDQAISARSQGTTRPFPADLDPDPVAARPRTRADAPGEGW